MPTAGRGCTWEILFLNDFAGAALRFSDQRVQGEQAHPCRRVRLTVVGFPVLVPVACGRAGAHLALRTPQPGRDICIRGLSYDEQLHEKIRPRVGTGSSGALPLARSLKGSTGANVGSLMRRALEGLSHG